MTLRVFPEKRHDPESRVNGMEHRFPAPLRDTVETTMREFRMYQSGEAMLVGVSGGPDSVALLHILLALTAAEKPRIGVAHLDHGLRPGSSGRDARFVRNLCRELGLHCHLARTDVREVGRSQRLSLEEAARISRYDFLNRVASDHRYDRIVLAHHADDNAEQILMALLRGAGTSGMAGIPAVRDRIARPLIRVRRSELLAYLTDNRIPFVLDESNEDLQFTRNRIRHLILPLVQSVVNPSAVDGINRFSEILRQENDWMETVAAIRLNSCRMERHINGVSLSAVSVRGLHPALARRVIRQAIREVKGDLRHISFSHIQSILDLADRQPDPAEFHLPGQVRALCSKTEIRLEKSNAPLRSPRPASLSDPERVFQTRIEMPERENPTIIHIPETGSRLQLTMISREELSPEDYTSPGIALLDMESLSFPLMLRQVREGDRFTPLGAPGSRKVQKFFIDHHVPVSCRKTCPVLVSGERIVWVCGHRIDDDFRLKPTTSYVLKALLYPDPAETPPLSPGIT